MKESYREDLASRSGLEPYAGDGNVAGVASARGNAGQPLSSEIIPLACRSCPDLEKAKSLVPLFGEVLADATESENLCMCGHSKRENREIPGVSNKLWRVGTAGKRLRRYSQLASSWEVRWSHSTCEAGEQNRNPGGGACGGKGITQWKCDSQPAPTGLSAGILCEASVRVATAGRDGEYLDRYIQGRSRMR